MPIELQDYESNKKKRYWLKCKHKTMLSWSGVQKQNHPVAYPRPPYMEAECTTDRQGHHLQSSPCVCKYNGKKRALPIDNLVHSSLLRKAKPIANYLPYPNKTQCVIMVQHSLNMGHQVCPWTVYFIYVVVSSKVLFRMWQCQVAPLRLSTPSIVPNESKGNYLEPDEGPR